MCVLEMMTLVRDWDNSDRIRLIEHAAEIRDRLTICTSPTSDSCDAMIGGEPGDLSRGDDRPGLELGLRECRDEARGGVDGRGGDGEDCATTSSTEGDAAWLRLTSLRCGVAVRGGDAGRFRTGGAATLTRLVRGAASGTRMNS